MHTHDEKIGKRAARRDRRDAIADRDITTAAWGQSCVPSTGLQAGVFPRSAGACSRRPPRTAVQLTAIGMRHHAYTERERERETAGGEGWPHGCRDGQ